MTVFKRRFVKTPYGKRARLLPEYSLAQLDAITRAREAWERSCAVELAKHGDIGTCVLGACIYDADAGQGKYRPNHVLIDARDVTSAQGSLIWEASVDAIVEMLRKHNINAEYDCGRMD